MGVIGGRGESVGRAWYMKQHAPLGDMFVCAPSKGLPDGRWRMSSSGRRVLS